MMMPERHDETPLEERTLEQTQRERVERLAMIDRIAAVVLAREPREETQAPAKPRTPVGVTRVASELEALARCIPALEGSAAPIIRIPGGQGDGSPAEHIQPWLSAMRRAMRRLAGLRSTNRGASLLLLAVYVYGGESARSPAWIESMYLALLSRDRRVSYLAAGKGPDANALRVASSRAILAAEEAYAAAEDAASDGRWLSSDLDEVSRAVRSLADDRAEVEAARPKAARVRARVIVSTDCAPCTMRLDVPAYAPCVARAGRVNARACSDRAQGKRVGRSCARRKHDRWFVRGASLVESERSGARGYRHTPESKTLPLLTGAEATPVKRVCSCAYGTCERCRARRVHKSAIAALRAFGDAIALAAKSGGDAR